MMYDKCLTITSRERDTKSGRRTAAAAAAAAANEIRPDRSLHLPMGVTARWCGEAISALNLANCGLARLPLEVAKLKNLKHLNLSHNRLATLPLDAFFESFPRLESLHIAFNGMELRPATFGALARFFPYLKRLNLAYNSVKWDQNKNNGTDGGGALAEAPVAASFDISKFKRLVEVNLAGCGLGRIEDEATPVELHLGNQLRNLILHSNGLRQSPIFTRPPPSTQSTNGTHTASSSSSSQTFQVHTLDLSSNELLITAHTVRDLLAVFPALKHIDLSGNLKEIIPDSPPLSPTSGTSSSSSSAVSGTSSSGGGGGGGGGDLCVETVANIEHRRCVDFVNTAHSRSFRVALSNSFASPSAGIGVNLIRPVSLEELDLDLDDSLMASPMDNEEEEADVQHLSLQDISHVLDQRRRGRRVGLSLVSPSGSNVSSSSSGRSAIAVHGDGGGGCGDGHGHRHDSDIDREMLVTLVVAPVNMIAIKEEIVRILQNELILASGHSHGPAADGFSSPSFSPQSLQNAILACHSFLLVQGVPTQNLNILLCHCYVPDTAESTSHRLGMSSPVLARATIVSCGQATGYQLFSTTVQSSSTTRTRTNDHCLRKTTAVHKSRSSLSSGSPSVTSAEDRQDASQIEDDYEEIDQVLSEDDEHQASGGPVTDIVELTASSTLVLGINLFPLPTSEKDRESGHERNTDADDPDSQVPVFELLDDSDELTSESALLSLSLKRYSEQMSSARGSNPDGKVLSVAIRPMMSRLDSHYTFGSSPRNAITPPKESEDCADHNSTTESQNQSLDNDGDNGAGPSTLHSECSDGTSEKFACSEFLLEESHHRVLYHKALEALPPSRSVALRGSNTGGFLRRPLCMQNSGGGSNGSSSGSASSPARSSPDSPTGRTSRSGSILREISIFTLETDPSAPMATTSTTTTTFSCGTGHGTLRTRNSADGETTTTTTTTVLGPQRFFANSLSLLVGGGGGKGSDDERRPEIINI